MIGTILLAVYITGAVFLAGYIVPEEATAARPQWGLAALVIFAWPFFLLVAIVNGNVP